MIASLEVLENVPYIHYLIKFQSKSINALVNSDKKVNVMTPGFATKLGFVLKPINVGI